MIEDDIVFMLASHDLTHVTVRTVYSPAWTTDWLSAEAKEKLRLAGIAPPGSVQPEPLIMLERAHYSVICPFCNSSGYRREERVRLYRVQSAIHYCNSCRQPFDRFKTL